MVVWSGSSVPSSWLLCDGSAVSRTSYANLFTEIGETFGVGDGSTTFNLPDMRGRVALGLDNMGGSSANRVTAAAADSLGGADGDEKKTIATGNLPSHTHSDGSLAADAESDHTHGKPAGATTGYVVDVGASSLYVDTSGTDKVSFTANTGSAGGHSHDVTGTTGATGSGTALDAMNPYMALNWLIKS
ncbi:MAG: tail fiber protein, partial [Actinomycetia bacterium]|nr:tail fiber protein [Actinomycetes bacterium]